MQKKFPQYLTSPLQVLFFEVDEIAIMFIALLIGLVLEGWTYFLIIVLPTVYSRLKKNYPRGFLKHILYFVGLTNMVGYPSFFEKEFIE
jgi:type IV conjugative transfer system protein TraL